MFVPNSFSINLSLCMVQVGFIIDEEIGLIHVHIVIGIYKPMEDFVGFLDV